ncbi:MAG: hypothetical protein AVO34_12555 [Firmicutes bacterium ML8_F2]|nr:MAG: hypothetical protein AVO34_12555 [Firmicutes bacterium ML8_F2]
MALDTYETEPLPDGHPLLKLPKKIKDRTSLNSHLGGITFQSLKHMLSFVLGNYVHALRGEKSLAVVNDVE